jgi:hypothetical protein
MPGQCFHALSPSLEDLEKAEQVRPANVPGLASARSLDEEQSEFRHLAPDHAALEGLAIVQNKNHGIRDIERVDERGPCTRFRDIANSRVKGTMTIVEDNPSAFQHAAARCRDGRIFHLTFNLT